ncbi:MAG: SRPBCC family protein [Dehalococcoidia bacterium]
MRIENRFRVGVPVADAWEALTDLRRVAPCLPGAELQDVDGDTYRGVVRSRLGTMQAEYRGVARFREVDEAGRRLVLSAEGSELHGHGRATATVTATLEPVGEATEVVVLTELNIAGPIAQFGRGVIQSVSSRLLSEFAAALEVELERSRSGLDADGVPDPASGNQGGQHLRSDMEPLRADPVDLLRLGGRPVLVRLCVALGVAAAVLAVVVAVRRRFS